MTNIKINKTNNQNNKPHQTGITNHSIEMTSRDYYFMLPNRTLRYLCASYLQPRMCSSETEHTVQVLEQASSASF